MKYASHPDIKNPILERKKSQRKAKTNTDNVSVESNRKKDWKKCIENHFVSLTEDRVGIQNRTDPLTTDKEEGD